jgi:hypothetical protein
MSTEMRSFSQTKRYYQITIEGRIDPSWSEWLDDLQLVSRKEANGMVLTTLSGALTDQAALRGLLNRLWDLNLVLYSIQQMDPAALS